MTRLVEECEKNESMRAPGRKEAEGPPLFSVETVEPLVSMAQMDGLVDEKYERELAEKEAKAAKEGGEEKEADGMIMGGDEMDMENSLSQNRILSISKGKHRLANTN